MSGNIPALDPPPDRTGARARQQKRHEEMRATSVQRKGEDGLVRGDYVPGKKTLGLELVADPQLLANNEWHGDETKTNKFLPKIRRLGASRRDTPKISPGASPNTEGPDADGSVNATSPSSARQRRLQQQQRNHAIEQSKMKEQSSSAQQIAEFNGPFDETEESKVDGSNVPYAMLPEDTQDFHIANGAESIKMARAGRVRNFFSSRSISSGKSGRQSPKGSEDVVNDDAGPPFSRTKDAENKDNQLSALISISAEKSEPPSPVELVIEEVKVTQQQQPVELASPALVRDRRAMKKQQLREQQEQKQQRREQHGLLRQFEEVLMTQNVGLCHSTGHGIAPQSTHNPKLPDPTVRDYFCTPTVSSSQIHDSSCSPVPVMAGLGHSRLLSDKAEAAAEASPKVTMKRIASNDSPTSVVEFQRLQGGEKSLAASLDTRKSGDTEKKTNSCNTSSDRKLAETAKSNKDGEFHKDKSEQSENKLMSKMKDFNIDERRMDPNGFDFLVNSCWVPKECGSKEMEAISETRKKWKEARQAAAVANKSGYDQAQNDMGRMEAEYSKPVDEEEPNRESKFSLFNPTWELFEKGSVASSKVEDGFEANFDVGEGNECNHPPEIQRDLQPIQLFRVGGKDNMAKVVDGDADEESVSTSDSTTDDAIPATVTSKPQLNKNPDKGKCASDHNSVDDFSTVDNDLLNSTIDSSTMNSVTVTTLETAPETTGCKCNAIPSTGEMPSLAKATWQDGVNGMMDVFDRLDNAINGKLNDDGSDGSFSDESLLSDFNKKKHHRSRRKVSRRSNLLRDQRERRKKRHEKSRRHRLDSSSPLVSGPNPQRRFQVSFSPDIDTEAEGRQILDEVSCR